MGTSSHLIRYITSSDKSHEMGVSAIVIFTFVFSFVGSEASALPGPDPAPVPAWKLIETEDTAATQEQENKDGEEPSKPDVGSGWISRYGYGYGIVPAGAGGKKEEKKRRRQDL